MGLSEEEEEWEEEEEEEAEESRVDWSFAPLKFSFLSPALLLT